MLHLASVALGPAQGPREKLGSSFCCPGPRHGFGFFLGTESDLSRHWHGQQHEGQRFRQWRDLLPSLGSLRELLGTPEGWAVLSLRNISLLPKIHPRAPDRLF